MYKRDITTRSENRLNRRNFLRKSAAGTATAGLMIVPRYVLGGPGHLPPSEKLNLAGIGVGNRGWTVIRQMEAHNIVALCDVDAKYLDKAADRYPNARKYNDFRRLIDWEEKNIDAVTVCSTDHTHAPASMAALRAGKHVYCEKPLTHSIYEARTMAEAARETGLATQMGNEAHSGPNYRRVVELVRSGAIGEVREVHCWCDQAWGNFDRPKHSPPIPENMHWDLWLGPAPYRPYHPCYHPASWRSWWDFGNGRLGDMGCHMIDLPFWALDLKYPISVEAEGPPVKPESSPLWLICHWEFPTRGDLPPVKLTWYDGGKRPSLQKEHNMPDYPEGTLFVGSDGMLIAQYGKHELFPKEKYADFQRPPQIIPNSPGHAEEWLTACKTGSPTGTHFGYSGPLTETVLLGTVAYRAGQKLEWDAENLKVTNCPEANQYIQREYREGWTL
jgi:predicted dehydrogenase